MQKYQNNVTSRTGDAVSGAAVAVRTLAGALATIYSDDGVTPTANPITSDSKGYFEFYAADGLYNIYINGVETYTDVQINDTLQGINGAVKVVDLAAASGAAGVGNDSDPGYSELMTAAEALSLRFHVWNYLTAAERTDAESGAPAIDTSVKIQKAIDRAALFSRPLDGCGTFRVGAQKIVFKSDADFSDATFFVYGSPAIAVEISTGSAANPTDNLYNKVIRLPKRTENKDKPGTGWAAQGIGVRAVNTYSCEVYTGNIVNFAIGFQETSYSTGNVYNEYHIGYLENNKVNLDFTPGNAGAWVNENVHIGGRLDHHSGEGTAVSGTRCIRLSNATNSVNNHLFFKPSMEGDVAEYQVENGGAYNTIIQARWESTTPKVLYIGTDVSHGTRNIIFGGYQAGSIAFTYSGTTGGVNELVTPGGGYSNTNLGVKTQNQSSSSSPVQTIYEAGTRPETAAAGDWAVKHSAFYLQGKRQADAVERVRLEYLNGRLYMGAGAVAPTAYIGNVGASSLGTNAAFFPTTNGTLNMGDSTLRWSNTYSVNFRPGAGTATWTSGTGTPEGAVTAAIGSLFTRTDGAEGTTLYVKESGAGNTGWSRVGPSIATITGATTLTTSSAATQLADATSAAFSVNLPTAASMTGRIINVKKIDSSANAVTLDGSGAETIDGAATLALTVQWQSAQIQSNGTAWYIL